MHQSSRWIALVIWAAAAGSALAQNSSGGFSPAGQPNQTSQSQSPSPALHFPANRAHFNDPAQAKSPAASSPWAEQPATFNAPISSGAAQSDAKNAANPVDDHHALPLPHAGEGKPLPKPGGVTHGREITGLPSIWTTFGSLVVVIGIFVAAMWMLRRGMPQTARTLPREALEVLGRAPLAGKQNVHLVRCGNKLLLLAISPSEVKTLTEITDPIEVDRLAGICVQSTATSATAAFKQVFQQFAGDRKTSGFLGNSHRNTAEIAASVDSALTAEDDDV